MWGDKWLGKKQCVLGSRGCSLGLPGAGPPFLQLDHVCAPSVSFRWWRLRECWLGVGCWEVVGKVVSRPGALGTRRPPTALLPAQGLGLCPSVHRTRVLPAAGERQEGSWALWEATSDCRLMCPLSAPSLSLSPSSCLPALSPHLSHSPYFGVSFSPPPPPYPWARFLLPLCRDPWRSPTAWMCPTRARSTPSICVRSARCWATTAGACSDLAAGLAAHPPARQRRRHPRVSPARVRGCPRRLTGLGGWPLRFSAHVC